MTEDPIQRALQASLGARMREWQVPAQEPIEPSTAATDGVIGAILVLVVVVTASICTLVMLIQNS